MTSPRDLVRWASASTKSAIGATAVEEMVASTPPGSDQEAVAPTAPGSGEQRRLGYGLGVYLWKGDTASSTVMAAGSLAIEHPSRSIRTTAWRWRRRPTPTSWAETPFTSSEERSRESCCRRRRADRREPPAPIAESAARCELRAGARSSRWCAATRDRGARAPSRSADRSAGPRPAPRRSRPPPSARGPTARDPRASRCRRRGSGG